MESKKDFFRNNIDGLRFVKIAHDSQSENKEILIAIKKAVDASPELRSKKQLIESFISDINEIEDVVREWNYYVTQKREDELQKIIKGEKLKPAETRKFLDETFRDGEVKTTGTDIDKILPAMSRFGGGNRDQKKMGVIEKIKAFFEKYFGIGLLPNFSENE